MPTLGLFTSLGPVEIAIIAGVGLLVFGRRLPEVGRGLGKSIVEFKRGLKDVSDEMDDAVNEATSPSQLQSSTASSPATAASQGTQVAPGTVSQGEQPG